MMPAVHYHIRWSGKPLDWQGFDSIDEAESRAREIVQRDESYRIEKFDGDCVRCMAPTEDSLNTILAEAIKKEEGQFGTLQVFDAETEALQIVAHQGFSLKFVDFFRVTSRNGTACGAAHKRKNRVVVCDVMTDPI